MHRLADHGRMLGRQTHATGVGVSVAPERPLASHLLPGVSDAEFCLRLRLRLLQKRVAEESRSLHALARQVHLNADLFVDSDAGI